MQNFNLRNNQVNNNINPISTVYHNAGNKLESKKEKKANTLETGDPVDTCISGVHDFSVHELISQPASPARLHHSGY